MNLMIARKSGLIIITNIFGSLFGFAGLYYVSRYMGPEALGMLGFGLGFIGLFGFISDFGFSSAHIKRVSEGKNLGRCNGTFATVKIITSLILVAVGFIAMLIWKNILHKELSDYQGLVISVLLLYFALDNISQIFVTTFIAQKNTVIQQTINLLGVSIRSSVIIIFAFLSFNALGLAFAYVIGACAMLLVGFFFFRRLPICKFSREYFMSYLKFAYPLMYVYLLSTLSLDKVLIQAYSTTEEVGFYYGIQQIMQAPLILSGAVLILLLPTMSEFHTKRDFESIRFYTKLSERYLSMITLPLTVFMFFYAQPLIIFLLGDKFAPAAPIFQLMSLVPLIASITRPYVAQIQGLNRPDIEAKISIISIILNVILNIILIPRQILGIELFGLGAAGAAVGLVGSWGFGLIAYKVYSYKLVQMNLNPHILKHAFSAFVAVFLISFSDMQPLTLVKTIILAGIYLIVYLIMLVSIKELKKDDVTFFLDSLNPVKMKQHISSGLDNVK